MGTKLSQIAAAGSAPASTDQFVGVTGGATDNLWTLAQVASGLVKSNNIRTILTAATTYYVSTTGSDSNPGTLAQPWATLQHAVDFIGANIDSAGFVITIQCAAGTYGGANQFQIPLGNCQITIAGNIADNTQVTINDTALGYACWQLNAPQILAFSDLTMNVTGNGNTVYAPNSPGILTYFIGVAFTTGVGITGGPIIGNFQGGAFTLIGPDRGFSITGNWSNFISSGGTNLNYYDIFVCTLNSTPNFSDAFIDIDPECVAFIESNFGPTGTATGKRFITAGDIIGPGSSSFTTLPGNAAGTVKSTGSYGSFAFAGGPPILVGSLPPAASYSGGRQSVTDSTATLAAGLGNIVAGGGGNATPVYSDGTNWRIG